MVGLILTVIFGLGLAYFATQNTFEVTVTLANLAWRMPVYFLAFGSLLLGLVLSGIISLADSISSSLDVQQKEGKHSEVDKTIESLSERIYHLELENARLQKIEKESATEEQPSESFAKPKNFFDKLRYLAP